MSSSGRSTTTPSTWSAGWTTTSDADVQGEVEFAGNVMPRPALLAASVRHVNRHLSSIRSALDLPADGHLGT